MPYKRRNTEKRKARSRVAARNRRVEESDIFSELSELFSTSYSNNDLPSTPNSKDQHDKSPTTFKNHLDKACIMRLSLSYLKIRKLIDNLPQLWKDAIDKKIDKKINRHYLTALEGFLMVISADGNMIYLSDNVSDYLGLTQIDLIGSSLFDYSHPCDHDEIKEMLNFDKSSTQLERSFFSRMKCTLTGKGRSLKLKSASYKVIHCTGHIIHPTDKTDSKKSDDGETSPSYLMLIASPIPHPSNIEVPLDKRTFVSQHSMNMKFTNCDERINEFLGYDNKELLGKSVYDYHHAIDGNMLNKSYRNLFSKGQVVTDKYRFLAKNGGYVWLLTQATVIYNQNEKPECVVCINYVLSGIEEEEKVLCLEQLLVPESIELDNVPSPKTETVFRSRLEDMEKSYSSDKEYFKGFEEEQDLTHLAPTAGDVCIPLPLPNNSFYKFSDLKVDDIADLAPLTTDETVPIPVTHSIFTNRLHHYDGLESFSKTNEIYSIKKDAFLNSTAEHSINHLSDRSSSNSSSSIDELRRISDLSRDFESSPLSKELMDNFVSLNPMGDTSLMMDKADENFDSDDFLMRAPYISMDIADDLCFSEMDPNELALDQPLIDTSLSTPVLLPLQTLLLQPALEQQFFKSKDSIEQRLIDEGGGMCKDGNSHFLQEVNNITNDTDRRGGFGSKTNYVLPNNHHKGIAISYPENTTALSNNHCKGMPNCYPEDITPLPNNHHKRPLNPFPEDINPLPNNHHKRLPSSYPDDITSLPNNHHKEIPNSYSDNITPLLNNHCKGIPNSSPEDTTLPNNHCKGMLNSYPDSTTALPNNHRKEIPNSYPEVLSKSPSTETCIIYNGYPVPLSENVSILSSIYKRRKNNNDPIGQSAKKTKIDAGPTEKILDGGGGNISQNSVLMNLLITGQDINYGYTLDNRKELQALSTNTINRENGFPVNKSNGKSEKLLFLKQDVIKRNEIEHLPNPARNKRRLSLISVENAMTVISRHDFDNSSIPSPALLQGQDLIMALDQSEMLNIDQGCIQ